MLPGKNFIACLGYKFVLLSAEPLPRVVCRGCGFLQDGVGRNHLTRNEVLTDAEVFERALCLSAPQLVGGGIDFAETVGFLAGLWVTFGRTCRHFFLPLSLHFPFFFDHFW